MSPILTMTSPQLLMVLSLLAMKLVGASSNKRNASPDCSWCYLDDWQPPSYFFGWISREDAVKYYNSSLEPEVTMTVITVIDTVRDTTTSTTTYPTGYTPPMTNAEGTQVQSIWDRDSKTSLLAYPTVFINWPESYVWQGESPVPNATTCFTAYDSIPYTDQASVTWTTIGNPQPTAPLQIGFNEFDWTYVDTATLADPLGSSYIPISMFAEGFWPLPEPGLGPLFPNEWAMQNCNNFGLGPEWGGFLTPWAWATVMSTSYVGAAEATAVA